MCYNNFFKSMDVKQKFGIKSGIDAQMTFKNIL